MNEMPKNYPIIFFIVFQITDPKLNYQLCSVDCDHEKQYKNIRLSRLIQYYMHIYYRSMDDDERKIHTKKMNIINTFKKNTHIDVNFVD